jgi:hypothetical protein
MPRRLLPDPELQNQHQLSGLRETLYPTPNYVLPGSTTNYINNKAQITDQRDDEIKIDHNFTSKYHAMGEYLDEYQSYAQNTESPGTTPISTETDFTHNKLAQVSLTQTLTPNMINTTSVAMNIYLLNLTLVGTDYINQVPGFSENLYYPNGLYANRTPVISFSGGMAGEGIQAARPIPHASDLDNTVSDNWSWLKGKNYFTAGVTFVFNTKRQVSGQQTNGSFAFNGSLQRSHLGTKDRVAAPAPVQRPEFPTGHLLPAYAALMTRCRICSWAISAPSARPATRLTAICMPSPGRRI